MELRVLTAVCTAIAIYSNAAMAVSFTPLGTLGGDYLYSGARDVSADGSVVVGISNKETYGEPCEEVCWKAFRWTREDGMVGLGDLAGGDFDSDAFGVSADGSVVVGDSGAWGWDGTFEAFRWTREDGMVGLGYLPGGAYYSRAFGVSADGSVVVGQGISASGYEAFRWTREDGMVGLGDLPGGEFDSSSDGVSADGSVVVGSSRSGYLPEAFRWTREGGMVGLGYLPGDTYSYANSVSADGSVVVGTSGSISGDEAFRWTREDGMVGLGYLPGGAYSSRAFDVSADGSVVVGRSYSASGREAFRWTREGGMQSVASILTTAGVDLTGWTLGSANGVSTDGYTIVGWGTNPEVYLEAWIADLSVAPPPDTTPVDLSGTIKTPDDMDICAMVLASGQYMFSCNPVGVFSLEDLPRESDGTVKCQMYADGFFPEITIVTESGSEAFVMTRSATCPSYNTPYDPGVFPDAAGSRIDISGSVLLQEMETPICAMVLANGQYMFSCDGSGSYALNIPLDTNGQFKLQVYADGFAPNIQVFDEFQTVNDVRMVRAVECQ